MAKPGDILGEINGDDGENNQSPQFNPQVNNTFNYDNSEEIAYLKSIDATVKELLRNGTRTSQSNARTYGSRQRNENFRDPYNRQSSKNNNSDNRNNKREDKSSDFSFKGFNKKKDEITESFLDSFEKEFLSGMISSDFKKRVSRALNDIANQFGVDIQDIPGAIGKELGARALNIFKETDLGKNLTGGIDKILNGAGASIKSRLENAGFSFSAADVTGSGNSEAFANSVRDKKDKAATSAQTEPEAEFGGSTLEDILNHVANIHAILDNQYIGEADSDAFHDLYDVKDMWKKVAPETSGPEGPTDVPVDDLKSNIDLNFGDKGLREVFKESKVGQWAQSLSNSKFGQMAQGVIGKGTNFVSGLASKAATKVGLTGATSTMATAAGASGSGAALSAGATAAAGGLSTLASAIPQVAAVLIALKVAGHILKKGFEALQDTTESLKAMMASASKAANRDTESLKKNRELAQTRLEEDTKALIEEPFNILKEAAEKAYDVWDANLRLINGTQGYDKADLQNLMGNYAERLREEGLSSVIGATDVTESLANVLESGLSGTAAEEFAYLATKLNAAIPSQDFFGYADEYASVAANMIANGYSQSEAIEYANSQLESFASSLLYSSRTLTGGFTTGLQNAEELYSDAVKISQAAKTGDTTNIASVLTAVSAVTGSIAPDLASTMTDAIVSAATGGNSSEIVALRSLAGINASNTEFLKALAEDPQSVFETLFTNLAQLQNMSQDSYMEVAEGLSSVFGVSMDAFARIDFNYLAEAISNMNTSNAALEENIKQLASGETTTTAEQLRLAQINEYMIDEGLAYVLDNEVARSIQEHMWDEQIARELMEASYAVELQGAALDFLEGIKSTVIKITNILNPFAWVKKIVNLVGTAAEAEARNTDIKQSLVLGRVGNGRALDLKNLTTTNADLNLTDSYVSLLGGLSAYGITSGYRQLVSGIYSTLSSGLGTNTSLMNNLSGALTASKISALTGSTNNWGVHSNYNWGSLSKSTYEAISGNKTATGATAGAVAQTTSSTSTATVSRLNEFLATQGEAVKNQKSYSEWAATSTKYGIANLSDALEEAGLTEQEIQDKFGEYETKAMGEATHERELREDDFWANSNTHFDEARVHYDEAKTHFENYYKYTIEEHQPYMESLAELTNSWLEKLYKKHTQFYNAWVDYFVNHTVYNDSYSYADVEKIKAQSKSKESGDLVNALAEALVKNTVDLKDPQVQTNALLSQILIVAQSIMQQNNRTSSSTISSSLVAQALGL